MLVEGPSAETPLLWEARMSTQAPEIDGVTLINDFEGAEPRPGEIRRLRITEAHDYDVVGTLLEPTESAPQFAVAGVDWHRAAGRSLMKCPICKKKEVRLGETRVPLLQRTLPHHRPGQLGVGEICGPRPRHIGTAE